MVDLPKLNYREIPSTRYQSPYSQNARSYQRIYEMTGAQNSNQLPELNGIQRRNNIQKNRHMQANGIRESLSLLYLPNPRSHAYIRAGHQISGLSNTRNQQIRRRNNRYGY